MASDAMADISLNTLGLILIVLVITLVKIKSSHADAAAKAPESATTRQPRQPKESELWRFRLHVEQLVAGPNDVHACDFQVDYFLHLNVNGHQVGGTLFGVRELSEEKGKIASSYAKIVGVQTQNKIEVELEFTGRGRGATEILCVERIGEEYVGRIKSGRHAAGIQNFVGSARGVRFDQTSVQD